MDAPDLTRPEEVDRLLRWPAGRAHRLARRGKLPHVLLPDGAIRFRLPEILALLENRGEPEAAARCGSEPGSPRPPLAPGAGEP